MTENNTTAIKLKNITKVYGKIVKTKALKGINLELEKNSFNSVIGQSGSGKSTMLNIIGTLDTPTEGDVWINGIKTTDMDKGELAKLRNETIGFIFQFHYLLPEFTALENVLMPYSIKDKKLTQEIKDRAIMLLERVGLGKVINNNAKAMSGGQQQRTAIARALMNNPEIILADEPTGNLDSDTTEQVYDLLRELNDEFGTTFLVITHDQHVAEKTDRIIELKDGLIEMDILNKRE